MSHQDAAMDDQLGKEIEASAEERKEIEVAGNILNDGVEAGISPRTDDDDDDDDDAPLMPGIKSADKNEGEAEKAGDADEAEVHDAEIAAGEKAADEAEVVHNAETEPHEVPGAPAIEFRRNKRTVFLRVATAGEAASIIAFRGLLYFKKTQPERVGIMDQDERTTGPLSADRAYNVVQIAADKPKPKPKAKGKAKPKAKGEAAKAAKGDDEDIKGDEGAGGDGRTRGRPTLGAPACVANKLISTADEDAECHKYITRLYKAALKDESLNAVIKEVRDLRKAYVASVGAAAVVEMARHDIEDVNSLLDRAVKAGARSSASIGRLSEAFPTGAPPKKARA